KGSGFVAGASLWWDGTHPTDTFINSSEMRATIPASYLTSAGNHMIKITNPTPGGGDSFNALTFQVLAPAAPPVPSIDHLNPAGVIAGASGVQVDVYGSNFQASGLTVTANGSGVPHVDIDSTHVRITAFNVNTFAQPGTVNIQVNNNGVQSNIVGLNVAAPGQNPVPSITSLSPDWVWSLGAASPELTVVITGTNFVDGAVVQWNGDDRPTKFISKTKVQATIFGSDQLDPAHNSVIVKNPSPGGGESNVLTLIVRALRRLYIPLVVR
ncbi:MAG TPA: IPT/TIG domain-containing protein, partial [Anaerolineae bacterium]|nr:IPT/TIG domain-containing protein [Anaerolineae bacterium]